MSVKNVTSKKKQYLLFYLSLIFIFLISFVNAEEVYFGNHTFISDLSNSSVKIATGDGNYTFGNINLTSNYLLIQNISTHSVVFNNTNGTFNAQIHFVENDKEVLYHSSNGSISCIDLFNCNEDINITIKVSNMLYVLKKINISEIENRTYSPFWISNIQTFSSGGVDTKTYFLASNGTETVNLTGFFVTNCPNTGDVVSFVTQAGSVFYPKYQCINSTFIKVNITDYQKATATVPNRLIFTYNNLPGGGGGGGGGSGTHSLNMSNVSKKACEYTYPIALKEPIEYFKINEIIDILKIEEKKTYTYTDIKTYIDYWQSLCSNLINQTLKPNFVCEKIYYFIVENNHNFTIADLNDLKNGIRPTIDISLDTLNNYYINYDSLCYLEGYSNKLPQKPSSFIDFYKVFDSENCTENLSMGFLNLGIPLGDYELGDLSCGKINFWKLFVQLEKHEDSYYLVGIKLYWIIGVAILIVLITLLNKSAQKKFRKIIKKEHHDL